jgi:hypothetical protein
LFPFLNLSLHKLLWFSLSFILYTWPNHLSRLSSSTLLTDSCPTCSVILSLFTRSLCFSHYFPITPHFCSCYPNNMLLLCSPAWLTTNKLQKNKFSFTLWPPYLSGKNPYPTATDRIGSWVIHRDAVAYRKLFVIVDNRTPSCSP